ncbi:MAG TPA: peptidoglycan-associated lipoprotein Pal [Gemmatimonadaceae bacterium]|jgi:peptidoglycan-associated lipoprotein|nr:peptidoglycan-associated lipoprotein Pal [Gemmatimonadaceae bacterium]
MQPLSRRSRFIPAVLVVAGVAAACGKKTPPAQPPAPAQAPTSAGPNQDSIDAARRDSIARAQRLADSLRAEQDRLAAALAAARNTITQLIYFDYNKADLTDQDKATLDAKIPVLNANPSIRIRVAGNCDARGSDEYNLALGQRRASAAKRYLVDHGVDAARIDVISYGKERPVAQGDNEQAYAQNRNDQFEITAGGDNIKAAGK